MVSEGSTDDNGHDAPKEQTKGLSLLFGPIVSVPTTSLGTLHLYGYSALDIGALNDVPASDPAERIRVFLTRVASLEERRGLHDEQAYLTSEQVDRLSDSELEHLSEVYAEALLERSMATDDGVPRPERGEDSASGFLVRVLQYKAQQDVEALSRLINDFNTRSNNLFDGVFASAANLGTTLSAYDELTRRAAAFETPEPATSHAADFFIASEREAARLAREREEEMELVRLTGKMTAQSAHTLKELAQAATTLMQQLDERDKRARQTTRTQISIALASVVVTAVLALMALIVSSLAYHHDKSNSEIQAGWQTDMISLMREGSARESVLEQEMLRLQDQMRALQEQVVEGRSQLEPTIRPELDAPIQDPTEKIN